MATPTAVEAVYEGGDRLRISTRGHDVVTDQPAGAGGEDRGPTPTELLVGSLVSCMGFYAQRFLRRNGVDPIGLVLSARFISTTDRPHRVSSIDIDVELPSGVPERLVPALRRVMETCTVHNTLREEPSITTTLRRDESDDRAAS